MTFEEWWEAPKTVAQICASPKNIAQRAYQAGRDAMREECQQECSAEADEYGVAQRISKSIGELK